MIKQKDVIAFFDERAGEWDAGMVRSDEKIGRILDNAKVTAGSRVLDIACGTGVLIGDYLRRNVESVTAVDISPEMIRIARAKFQQENVRFVRGDASRSREGSGLGLSIAQSLTQLQKGLFEIVIDGDLFKAHLTFPPAAEGSK